MSCCRPRLIASLAILSMLLNVHGAWAFAEDAAAAGPELLAQGKRSLEEDPAAAIQALESAIEDLKTSGDAGHEQLVDAWVYLGAAHLRTLNEAAARASFREALSLQPSFRLRKDEWPPQVIRVFEAVRTGKAQSAMQPPSTVPKKAGIGAATVGLIVGGAAALAGGAAVAASHGGGSSTPTPAPTPTPNADTSVTPTVRTGGGAESLTFVSADPPPGTSISVGQPITMVLQIDGADPARVYMLVVDLNLDANTQCGLRGVTRNIVPAGTTAASAVSLSWGASCPAGAKLTWLRAQLTIPTADLVSQEWRIQYGVKGATASSR